ncbi:MAG: HlyD family efflux transporter periplasmic adaptor subunit [Hyphomicrobiaceae bacterium]|nr:MAG: HlyD family efflux transporter periplasmic adaptor subunit [Hyphomicrobiaceae bacterium]
MSRASRLRASEVTTPKSGSAALGSSVASRPPADSRERLRQLKEEFEAHVARQPGATEPASWLPQALQDAWKTHRRLLKAIVGALIVVVVGWMPLRSLLETTSTEAVVNARLITLRAPIEGQVVPTASGLGVGTEVERGTPVLRIVNPRAERGQLDELRRQIDRLEGAKDGMVARLRDLNVLRTDLVSQVQTFQEARVRQLSERAAELTREVAAAQANRDAAEKALVRVQPMSQTGSIPKATLERYARDARVTAETYAAVQHRLAALQVELDAAKRGAFVGDSYNDRPRSSQRVDEIDQRISELTADLRERDARVVNLRKELAAESLRYAEVAAADLTAPVSGSIWEVLTAAGESVVRGQELLRLLDCSGVVVTAAVSETVYNRLHIGQAARFRFRGESGTYEGRVVNLTGVAATPANFAIQPGALAKEPYRVTVALPGLAEAGQCKVGRTGRVTFGK